MKPAPDHALAKHPKCLFRGSFVALPTPFRGGQIDYAALQDLVEFHIAHHTDGLVVAGTTGEAATLSENERRSLFETSVAIVRGRLPLVVGVGTNCTRSTVEMATFAASVGVDAVLVVTPYYNKPSRRGLVLHFSHVADAVEVPVILYNVPSRTGVDMVPEVVAELGAKYKHVVAVKEALPSIERVKRLLTETNVGVFCGEDGMIADFMGLGAVGVIGVVNNVLPAEVAELVRCSAPGGNSVRAAALVERCAPMVRDLFIESNPVPVKAALAMMRRCAEDVRPPLAPLEETNRNKLRATMKTCGLV
jgi:4-hydroxy-tetrahydrodipicolinate synthase